MSELRIRQAVRALLVTDADEIMLVRFEFPKGTVWSTPGGGLERGEDHLAALHRELEEEVGLSAPTISRHVWNREHITPHMDGRYDGQQDRFYLVPTQRFEALPVLSWDQLRAENLHEIRWWTFDEIDEATASGTLFAPRRLGELLRSLAAHDPSTAPIDTGI
jgi:8-oxo-dGTP pyrophosphatase MutT (NUDIX family)